MVVHDNYPDPDWHGRDCSQFGGLSG
jgi:hypothetical protein